VISEVYIEKLILTQFRNYTYQSLTFIPQINVLTGRNGMGKTNVLDAIYMLCLGKSYFNSSDSSIMMHGTQFFRLEGHVSLGEGMDKVVIKSQAASRKEIEVSGKKLAKIKDHIGHFLCVIVAPDDIHDLLNTSEERRNFINNTLVQLDPVYLDDLMIYTALLKQRNALLKSFHDKKYFDKNLLDAISVRMRKPAQDIFHKRKKFIQHISPVFQDIYREISGENEVCSLNYESQLHDHLFDDLLQKHLEKDRVLNRTTAGIHKDDLHFIMNDTTLKTYASQGQLKSFVLSLKLAQYQYLKTVKNQKPVLLLDDIFDKLDPSRVTHLLKILTTPEFGQVFITDTQKDRIHEILLSLQSPHQLFHVDNGTVIESVS
jgi:DNA replication and repair protein RecF